MGKPTGFMEYERELPQDRSPLERVRDWNEFHEHFSEEKLRHQGARCMDCGIPFCHTGQLIRSITAVRHRVARGLPLQRQQAQARNGAA